MDSGLRVQKSHFNRERVPERTPHAKGHGAFGELHITNDVSITAAEYINGELVPHSGVSDVADVLDSAENRTSGEAYRERETKSPDPASSTR